MSRTRDDLVRRFEFFSRTSPPARSHPTFLYENSVLPPLVCVTSVEALKALVKEGLLIELCFANEEGDPSSVELGYIRMDDFLWGTSALGDLALQPEPEPMDDFQPIKRKKGKEHFEVNVGFSPQTSDFALTSPRNVGRERLFSLHIGAVWKVIAVL